MLSNNLAWASVDLQNWGPSAGRSLQFPGVPGTPLHRVSPRALVRCYGSGSTPIAGKDNASFPWGLEKLAQCLTSTKSPAGMKPRAWVGIGTVIAFLTALTVAS